MPRFPKIVGRQRHAAPGASPGTLVLPKVAAKPVIHIMSYGRETLDERDVTPGEIQKYLDLPGVVTWFDVRGLGDEGTLREIGRIFMIHPLALEDVVHSPQRPKSEEYEHHEFIITRMLNLRSQSDMHAEQLSIFLGKNYVLTFQENQTDCLEVIRNRIRKRAGLHRTSGADYLCYSVLDAVIDNYYPVLESYGEYLEDLETQTVMKPKRRTLAAIHSAKRELMELRRVIWPQRDAINQLIRSETPLLSHDVRIFLRDCYDHAVQVMDMVETYREITSGLHDVYLSSIGNRTNEIMKVLTIISTIFIPLTFIVGLYGMNFDTNASPYNMPELKWQYGYLYSLGLMAIIALALTLFFVRKGWIFGGDPDKEPPKKDKK